MFNPIDFATTPDALPDPMVLIFVFMGLFLLLILLGALFFKLLLWEQQFNEGRETWLQQIQDGVRDLKSIQRQSRKIAVTADNLPFATEPMAGLKTLGFFLKFLKMAGPLRYVRFFF